MPSTRDLWLILRAQDQASRALNAFSGAVRKAGTDSLLAQMEARKGAQAAALGQNQLAQAGLRNEVAQLANENAMIRTQVAQAKLGGTTKAYLDSQKQAIIGNEREIQIRRDMIIKHQDESLAIKDTIQGVDQEIAARKRGMTALKEHGDGLSKFTDTLKGVSQTATTIGIGLVAMGAMGVAAIASVVKAGNEYDRQVRLTSTQVEGMGEHLKEIGDIGLRVANSIGVSFKSVQPALYDIFSSMNVGVADGEKLLTQFAKAAVAGQTDIQSVSRGTIAVMNSMQLSVEDVTRILDVQFKFIQKGVGTYDEWATKIGLVAPSANRAGQSIEMMMATLASASKMAGVAARAGTAVARSFDAFSNPAAVAKLKALGVEAATADGNFRPFVDVMFDFRKALDKVEGGQVGKMKVILDIFKGAGGTIEARRFLQQILLVPGVLENLNTIYGETQNAAGSMDQAYGVMADSMSAKTEKMKSHWETLKITVRNLIEGALSRLVDVINGVLNAFNNLSPSTQKLIIVIGLLTIGFTLLFGSIFLIIGLVAGMAAAFAAVGLSMTGVLLVVGLLAIGIGLLVVGFGFLLWQLKTAYDKSEDFRSAVNRVKTDFWALGQMIKRAWKEHVEPALDATAKIINEKLKPAWDDFWATVRDKVEPKIHEFADFLRDRVDPTMKSIGKVIKEDINPALSDLADWWKKNKDWVGPLIADLARVAEKLAQIAAVITLLLALGGLKALGLAFRLFALDVAGLGTVLRIVYNMYKLIKGEFKDPLFIPKDAMEEFMKLVLKLKTKWEEFLHWWDTNPIFNAIKNEFDKIKTLMSTAFQDLLGDFGLFFGDANKKTGDGMGQIKIKFDFGLGDIKKAVKDGFTDIGNSFAGGMNDLISRALGINLIKTIFNVAIQNAKQSVDDGLRSIANSFGGLPGMLINAIPSPGSILWGAGQNVVQGLIGGIRNMMNNGSLSGVLSDVGQYIKDHKGPKSVDLAMLRPAGQWIMQGLIHGINDMTPILKSNLQEITAQISPTITQTAPQAAPVTRNATFNITVNQADRSARQLAQDLGQELAGML